MKEAVNNRFLLAALLACLGLASSFRADAQQFRTLYSFTNGSDGATPYSGLILSGSTLYGTASESGNSNNGTVFSINTDGTSFAILHGFSAFSSPNSTNSDGANPMGGLVLSGNTLYGTADDGGNFDNGTIFSIKTDGTGFTSLYSFTTEHQTGVNLPGVSLTNFDGAHPFAGLTLSNAVLYGTTGYGGTSGNGTVFAFNTESDDFVPLASFSGGINGGLPNGQLALAGDTLYGTTVMGGGGGGNDSTVFAVNPAGGGLKTVHGFSGGDGAGVFGGLIEADNILYGTTTYGGPAGEYGGSVFAVNTDGSGFRTLHFFAGGDDGSDPYGGLVLSGHTLYGTTSGGGVGGSGTVFAVNTDGTGFTNLYSFTAIVAGTNIDGAASQAGLTIFGNTLYGTTLVGGSAGDGTIFSLSLPGPQLTMILSGSSVVVTWPTNFVGFNLQSATNVGPSAAWHVISTGPSIINGLNIVTDPIADGQQFYRLSQ